MIYANNSEIQRNPIDSQLFYKPLTNTVRSDPRSGIVVDSQGNVLGSQRFVHSGNRHSTFAHGRGAALY